MQFLKCKKSFLPMYSINCSTGMCITERCCTKSNLHDQKSLLQVSSEKRNCTYPVKSKACRVQSIINLRKGRKSWRISLFKLPLSTHLIKCSRVVMRILHDLKISVSTITGLLEQKAAFLEMAKLNLILY